MHFIKKLTVSSLALIAMIAMTGCAPEVGSDAWCDSIKEKPKADLSANEAADFAQHCILK